MKFLFKIYGPNKFKFSCVLLKALILVSFEYLKMFEIISSKAFKITH